MKSLRATSILVLVALALLAGAALAQDAVRQFRRAWAEAGNDPVSQCAALDLLAADPPPPAIEILAQVASSADVHPQVADRALAHLSSVRLPEGLAWMADQLGRTSDVALQVLLARVFAAMPGQPRARDALLAALGERDWRVRSVAAQGLSRFPEKPVVDALVAALREADGRLAGDLRRSLAALTGEQHDDFAGWDSWWRAQREAFDFSNHSTPAPQHGTLQRRQLYQDPIESNRVIFIIDVSGSMQVTADGEAFHGMTRLDCVKHELSEVIEQELSEESRFNVITFSDGVRACWDNGMQRGSSTNRRRAIAYVQNLLPDGATNSLGALEAAFSDPNVDTIYFLSDGSPTAGDSIVPTEILGRIRSLNRTRNIRINTICFLAGNAEAFMVLEDKSAARSFMQQLADESGGSYRLVE